MKGHARTPEPQRGYFNKMNIPLSYQTREENKHFQSKRSKNRINNTLLRDLMHAREEALMKEKMREREKSWNYNNRPDPNLLEKRQLQTINTSVAAP